jgi:hypothetical protein
MPGIDRQGGVSYPTFCYAIAYGSISGKHRATISVAIIFLMLAHNIR